MMKKRSSNKDKEHESQRGRKGSNDEVGFFFLRSLVSELAVYGWAVGREGH